MGNVMPFSDYSKQQIKVDWLIDDLFIVGGFSLLVGDPKCGKSQFTRHLISACLQGESFMGYKINDCKKIMYLALEDRVSFLISYLKKNGIKEEENRLLIADGTWLSNDNFNHLENEVKRHQPSLCIIDTYAAFTNINDFNNFAEVYKTLQKISLVARSQNCHIVVVHHKNKGESNGSKSILGSQGFFASVDLLMLLSGAKKEKQLDIQSRYSESKEIAFNMTPFLLCDWKINSKDQTCDDALLDAVRSAHPNGYEFRNFVGYSDRSILAAKANLINKGLIEANGGKKNQPLLLRLKNSSSS